MTSFFLFIQICPVCAALPGGDPNHVTDDLGAHLSQEHRASNRELVTSLFFVDSATFILNNFHFSL